MGADPNIDPHTGLPIPPVADLGIYATTLPKDALCDLHGDRPATFACAMCKKPGCDACRFGKLGARVVCRACNAGGLPEPIPWERRNELGVARTFVTTLQLACTQPGRFFRTAPLEPDAVGAFEFGLVCFAVGQIAVVLQAIAAMLLFGSAAAIGARVPALIAVFGGYGCMMVAMIPAMVLHVPVTGILSVGSCALGTHGTLELMGAARAPFMDGTVRAMSYAFAPHVLVCVPVIGPLVSYVWMLAIEAVALREVHGCSSVAAIVAVLGYRLLFVGLLVGMYVLLGAAIWMSVSGR